MNRKCVARLALNANEADDVSSDAIFGERRAAAIYYNKIPSFAYFAAADRVINKFFAIRIN